MINAANERVWVKFHFRTQQGIENLTDEEAEASSPMIAKATAATCSTRSRRRLSAMDAVHSGDD